MRRKHSILSFICSFAMCCLLGTASCGKLQEGADGDGGGTIDAAVTCVWNTSNWDECNFAP